jgi:hypothetical protein
MLRDPDFPEELVQYWAERLGNCVSEYMTLLLQIESLHLVVV